MKDIFVRRGFYTHAAPMELGIACGFARGHGNIRMWSSKDE